MKTISQCSRPIVAGMLWDDDDAVGGKDQEQPTL